MVPPQGGRKHPEQKMIKIDTKDILFICGGAFDGIEKVIAKRMQTHVVGFKKGTSEDDEIDTENMLQYVSAMDLKGYGLIPELIGRLPVLTYLDPLDEARFENDLNSSKKCTFKAISKTF